jgi:hypothetical protein
MTSIDYQQLLSVSNPSRQEISRLCDDPRREPVHR